MLSPRSSGSTTSPLDALRSAAAPHLPLPALDADSYARGHALFEARSDQRELLTDWLWSRLASRVPAPVRVLSVGCGDGTVDAELARRLRDGGSAVTYDGVEPFAGSAAAWRARLARVGGVTSGLQQVAFDDHDGAGTYDVVVFVHSLYYVADLPRALRQAVRLLAPGGELLVLHAPRAELNALVDVLAPQTGGHPQWFSDRVTGVLRTEGLVHDTERLHASLDLTGASDLVLDFTVQAFLTPALRLLVQDRLSAMALHDLVVPHPLDAFIVPVPG